MQRRVFYARLSGAGRGQTVRDCGGLCVVSGTPAFADSALPILLNPRLRRCHHAQALGRTFLILVYSLPLVCSSYSN